MRPGPARRTLQNFLALLQTPVRAAAAAAPKLRGRPLQRGSAGGHHRRAPAAGGRGSGRPNGPRDPAAGAAPAVRRASRRAEAPHRGARAAALTVGAARGRAFASPESRRCEAEAARAGGGTHGEERPPGSEAGAAARARRERGRL